MWLGGVMMALMLGVSGSEIPKQDIGALLGSGRTDLVYKMGGTRKAILYIKKNLPIERLHDNGACEFNETEDTLVFVEEAPWAWKISHLAYGSLAAPSVLVRFDETSAFEPWTFKGEGALLRFKNGQIVLAGNAQLAARERYGLKEGQRFLGLVGSHVLYYDAAYPTHLFCFDNLGSRKVNYWVFPDKRVNLQKFTLKMVVAAYTLPSPDEAWLETYWQHKDQVPMRMEWQRLKFSEAKPWVQECKPRS